VVEVASRRRRRERLAAVLLAIGLLAILGSSAPSAQAADTGFGGTVTGAEGLEEVEVCVVELLPSETCTFPDASGQYQLLGLAPGIYRVEFLPSYRSHLVAQYYNHRGKLEEANSVLVSSGLVTRGIDADLELGGQIEGRVADNVTNVGLEEVEVCAQQASTGAAVSCARSGADGGYALPSLPPGSYRVGFWGQRQSAIYAPQYYDNQPSFFESTVVPVTAGATVTAVDAELQIGARVRGTVTSAADGSPLAGIAVCILKGTAAAPESCTYSEPNGEYDLPGLASGSYQVVFSPEFSEFSSEKLFLPEADGWRTQYYAAAETRAGSTALSLVAPTQRAGVDAALLPTFTPPAPLPPPAAPDTAIASPPVANRPPEAKPKGCKKGYRKKKVKGKVRCVKIHKQKQAQRRHSKGRGRGSASR
jgi:Carboxypeptidase regulatory-like domain